MKLEIAHFAVFPITIFRKARVTSPPWERIEDLQACSVHSRGLYIAAVNCLSNQFLLKHKKLFIGVIYRNDCKRY